MVKREYVDIRKDGVRLFKSYSDKGLKIRKVGTEEIYDEATDVETSTYTYEEVDE